MVARLRLDRDALTRAGYAGLATWTWFLYGWGAVLPLLRTEQGTSRTVMGVHSAALAFGSVVAGLVTVPVARALHRRGALLLGLGIAEVGVVLLCLGRSPAQTLPAVMLVGVGGPMLLNSVNPALSDHHGPAGAAALSEGNAVAAGVGVVSPAAVGACVALGLTWRPAMLMLLPIGVGLVGLVRRVPRPTPAFDAGPSSRGGRRVRLPRRFWRFALVVMLCVGVEFACTAWSADLMRQRVGLSAAGASTAVIAVVGGMAVGRWVVGRLALRRTAVQLMLAGQALTVLGWLVVWVSTAPGPALAGLVVTGLGISGQFPLGVSLAYAAAGGDSDQATGVLSLGIGLFAGLSPFCLGALADATSTHTAFVVVPLLVAAAAALLVTSRRAPQPLTA